MGVSQGRSRHLAGAGPCRGQVHLIVMELVILICLLGIPEMVKTQNPTLDGLIVSKNFIQRLDYFLDQAEVILHFLDSGE